MNIITWTICIFGAVCIIGMIADGLTCKEWRTEMMPIKGVMMNHGVCVRR